MNESIATISLLHLAVIFIPAFITIGILFYWSLNPGNAIYAVARMLFQLLIIGYVLTYIFASGTFGVIFAVLCVMVLASSWIALRTVKKQRLTLYKYALLSMVVGGGLNLFIVTQIVLQLETWYEPRVMIPLAGMIFASTMNSISLAADRLNAEMERGSGFDEARREALQTALIPVVNSLFAVGVVSVPGMMTGQILSGVSPLIAVRYQIMVMCMIFSASGISTACFLVLAKPIFIHPDGEDIEESNS